MSQTFFRFSNPYTGTTDGTGDGTSIQNASGNWSTFLSRLGASNAQANVLWMNSDAYLPSTGGDLAAGSAIRTFWNVRPQSGAIVRSYDVGSALSGKVTHAIFDSLSYSEQDTFDDNPQWSLYAGSVWQKTFGVYAAAGRIRSVWANDGEVRGQNGDTRFELCHRASRDTCLRAGDWSSSDANATSQTLYVNSGSSSQNPDQVFGGISFSWYDSSRSWGAQFSASQRLTLERWQMLGGGITFGQISNINTEDLLFEDLRINCQGNNVGLNLVSNNASGALTNPLRRIFFDRLELTRRNAYSLVERIDTEGLVGQDHIYIRGYVSNIVLRNPTVKTRMTHGGVSIYADTSYTSGDTTWPRNIEIYGTSRTRHGYFEGPSGPGAENCYCRLLQSQTDGPVMWRNLTAVNSTAGHQISGNARMDGCYLDQNDVAYNGYDNPGNDNNKGGSLATFGESADLSNVGCSDILVTNTIFNGKHGYLVKINQDAGTPYNDFNGLRFNHCTFIDVVSPYDKVIRPNQSSGDIYGPASSVGLLLWESGGLADTRPQFNDCAFITPSGSGFGTAIWNGSNFANTAYPVEALPTVNAASWNNGVWSSLKAAGMSDYNKLLDGSPLRGLGFRGVGGVDFNGNVRELPNSMGASE